MVGDIEFDAGGNIFVGVEGSGISRYSLTGGGGPAFTIPTSTYNFNFGPDGKLYVATPSAGILKFDPDTGSALGTFVPVGSQGLMDVKNLVFGDDGIVYVNSRNAKKILEFDAATGAPLGMLIQYGGTTGITDITSIAYIVPEPMTVGLLGIGMAWWTIARRRRRQLSHT